MVQNIAMVAQATPVTEGDILIGDRCKNVEPLLLLLPPEQDLMLTSCFVLCRQIHSHIISAESLQICLIKHHG